MSIKKIIAIGVIYLAGWLGWWFLGTVTSFRSHDFSSRLNTKVADLWGTDLAQKAPAMCIQIPGTDQVRWVMPVKNRIKVDIKPDYRKKGLIWYPTYHTAFDGTYTLQNPEDVMQKVRLHFDFPAPGATYDAFAMHLDGKRLVVPVDTRTGIDEIIELAPGAAAEFRIQYKTRGKGTWRYQMDENTGRVQDFELAVRTGFKNIDYTAENSFSPMEIQPQKDGMLVIWKASDLITNADIGIVVPEKLNPGPLTTRITYFAPVCLFFFFILIATISIMYKINIHPMHYLFVAAGFFAFHLLLSYMAGRIWIHTAFIISALTSVTLVSAYLAKTFGREFPWKVAMAGQLFFLVLFSYSFFIEGITGLTVTIGSVITLAILMWVTAHVNWDDVFKRTALPKEKSAAFQQPVSEM